LKTILPVNTIVLKRSPKDQWVNNYNKKCIVNWDANMNIQYVINAYNVQKKIVFSNKQRYESKISVYLYKKR